MPVLESLSCNFNSYVLLGTLSVIVMKIILSFFVRSSNYTVMLLKVVLLPGMYMLNCCNLKIIFMALCICLHAFFPQVISFLYTLAM